MMSKRGSKAKDTLVHIDPAHIRFTHSRIRPFFSGCGRRVEDTMNDILEGRMRFEDLPFITVIAMEGGDVFFSLNNRRMYVIKQLKERGFLQTVPVRIKSDAERRKLREKYTIDRCSDTATYLYEVGAGGKEEEEQETEGEECNAELEDVEANDSKQRETGDENASRTKGQNSGRGRNGAQGGKRQEEIAEEDAPVITATAKPKRRADKKSKASRQSTEASTNASSANITLHVSSELLGHSVDMSLEPPVFVDRKSVV